MKFILMTFIIGIYSIAIASDIIGQGFLKTQGGSIQTCSGEKVYIQKYKNDLLKKTWLYKFSEIQGKIDWYTTMVGMIGAKNNKSVKLASEIDNDFILLTSFSKKYLEETICDSNGNFEFFDMPKGNYIITTTVTWKVAGKDQGGFLNKLIVHSNKKQKIIITQ